METDSSEGNEIKAVLCNKNTLTCNCLYRRWADLKGRVIRTENGMKMDYEIHSWQKEKREKKLKTTQFKPSNLFQKWKW